MASPQPIPKSPHDVPEESLLTQTNDLIARGFELQNMQSLGDLERWDDAVNDTLSVINDQVLNAGMGSPALKRRIECLLELYLAVLASVSELQQAQTAKSKDLQQQRRMIAGQ